MIFFVVDLPISMSIIACLFVFFWGGGGLDYGKGVLIQCTTFAEKIRFSVILFHYDKLCVDFLLVSPNRLHHVFVSLRVATFYIAENNNFQAVSS